MSTSGSVGEPRGGRVRLTYVMPDGDGDGYLWIMLHCRLGICMDVPCWESMSCEFTSEMPFSLRHCLNSHYWYLLSSVAGNSLILLANLVLHFKSLSILELLSTKVTSAVIDVQLQSLTTP
jgi:hypothetical protein